MATKVIIIRHGQSSYNLEQMIQGRCDKSVLTEQGRAQAEKVGSTLRQLEIKTIYSSPLQRAKESAEIIRNCFDVSPALQVAELLQEVDLPLWEEKKKDEIINHFPEDYRCWKTRPHEFYMVVNGQKHYPVLSLYEQAQEFWKSVISQHDGETIAIVAHNGINRCLISSAIGVPPALYHSIQQSNCGINVLNFQGGWGDPVELESLNQTAHLGVKLPSPRKNKGIRLLLVRHGETDWNKESRFQGKMDIPLNENGKEQGRKAADFLKETQLDFAVSSPMLRPKETAELILSHHSEIELELKEKLLEISHGNWEGKLKPEIEQEYPELLKQWQETPEVVQMPEGENLQQVWDRAIAAWEEIVAEKGKNTEGMKTGIVVAHDAINKVILCALLGLSPSNFWNVKQGNGAVSVIDYPEGKDGAPVLQAINITSHLATGIFDQTAAGAL
ncbi:histidine phosphatase family protein [Euhalothece natronophila Z-M001]|uniref:Histidine phosphatase family protein n=1 Tax=Euhalothece natronophila Z-M001 TaxID=522448 RepID=A0A5B8NKG1_9CHRO|nr:histidine phosphatase family protein [Euhalothece natronophila]QDZ39466.1 histidine phosphatase family protein [Euhalothece natronophila Z-M001]